MTGTVKSLAVAGAIALATLAIAPAKAAVIFAQDFESGLGAGETIAVSSPGFGLTNAATLGNGTFGVGHTNSYINSDDDTLIDVYTFELDLSGVGNATLTFDYSIDVESLFDEFAVLVNLSTVPPVIGGITLGDVVEIGGIEIGPAFSGEGAGTAVFDLSGFDGQSGLSLAFGLTTDLSNLQAEAGYFIDNILVEGTIALSTPGTLALFSLGVAGLGAMALRRAHGLSSQP